METSKAAPQPRLANQASQAVLWNLVFLPAKLIADIGVTLLQLNVLSLAAFGVLSIIRASISLFGVWIDLGIERALPKFLPEVQRDYGRAGVRQLLRYVMLIKLGVLAIVAVGLWLMRGTFLNYLIGQVQAVDRLGVQEQAQLIDQIERNGWFFISAIVVLLVIGACYDVLMAYLVSYFKQRAWNSITLANGLLQPFLIATAVLLGWDVTGVVVAMVLTAAFGLVLAAWQVGRVARQDHTIPSNDAPPQQVLRRFVPYSSLSYLFNLSDMAASSAFVIFFLQGLEQAAILAVASNFVRQILTYLYMPMQGLQVPLFTRARSSAETTLSNAYAAVTRLLLLLLVPGGVGLILLAQPLVLAQYPTYLVALPTIMVLTPLLFGESLLSTAHNALMVSERYKPLIVARLVVFISLPLGLLLVPQIGVLGAAIAIGGSRIIGGLISTFAGHSILDLRFPHQFAVRIIGASGVMAVALFPLVTLLPDTARDLIGRLLVFAATLGIAAIGAAVFVIAFRLLGGLDARDRQQLAGMRLPFKRLVLKVL